MSTFTLSGNPAELLESIFPQDEGGFLEFGLFGASTEPCMAADLLEGPREFSDFIMEGGIRFLVSARSGDRVLHIDVRKLGSSRDAYLDSAVRLCLKSRGCTILSPDGETSS